MKKPAKKTSAAKKPAAGKSKGASKGKSWWKKILLRTFFGMLVLAILLPFIHYFVFPQQSRSILIDYSDFKKDGRLYYNAETPPATIDSLKQLIVLANLRVDRFWEGKQGDPKIIYCGNDADFEKYGSENKVPALTIMKLGSYVVLSKDGLDLDIIAHEICHAELYERIGFYAQEFKIPTWFSEGLAMQCDNRAQYSEDTLRAMTKNLTQMDDVKLLESPSQFFAGSNEEVMMHYRLAKHLVKEWKSAGKLEDFIGQLNDGESFDGAY